MFSYFATYPELVGITSTKSKNYFYDIGNVCLTFTFLLLQFFFSEGNYMKTGVAELLFARVFS